jgi:hypothetical protein
MWTQRVVMRLGRGFDEHFRFEDLPPTPVTALCTPRGPPWFGGRGENFGLFEGPKRHFIIRFFTTDRMRTSFKTPIHVTRNM